jgi:integrase
VTAREIGRVTIAEALELTALVARKGTSPLRPLCRSLAMRLSRGTREGDARRCRAARLESAIARGAKRYRVEYRLGGREAPTRYGGSFKSKREADERKRWLSGELAARRVPDLGSLETETKASTLTEAAERWFTSRVDVAPNTKLQHRSAMRNLLAVLGTQRVNEITPDAVSQLVTQLSETRKRETVRKSLLVLGMVLDHAGIEPNPARAKSIKLPREQKTEINPPTAEHVEAVVRLLPTRYRLPALVLDATGMRLGELEMLTWGDVDEPRQRWRVSAGTSKTGHARWVPVWAELFQAVTALVPREDRVPERRVFQGFGADRFRTAVTRACTASGIPHFSPHDLRHRRISLLHLVGVPWARIGEHVGQRSLRVTADTYSHVLADERELDYAELMTP